MQLYPLTTLVFSISFKVTPEILWGTLHGFIGLGFVVWWQATVALAAAMRKMQ